VCLEGHKQGCPHLIADAATPSEAAAETAPVAPIPPSTPEPFRFHSGEKLTAAEASRMMSAIPVTMVLCAGAQQAGKTTFLARIGEMFRNGSFRDFRFAGSKTLSAFERVTWLATIASGAGRPETKRTHRVEKDTFFHIRIQSVGGTKYRSDLLITDLPGEIFPAVLSTKEVCEQQLAVASADHLVLFVDCGSMIDSAKRHSEKDKAYRFLSQVKKCRHEPSTLHVTVVFSRWDKVTSSENQQAHKESCKVLEQYILERFEPTFGGLRFDYIAARPDAGTPPSSAEIQALFGHWMEQKPSFPFTTVSRNPKPARDFCAFGLP
jgi:GTP-binding protein EngB required for normal cell division